MYRGSWMFAQWALSAIVYGWLAGAAVVAGAFFGVVFFGGLAGVLGAVASSHCRRVELHADGVLMVHYFLRRRLVTRAEAVQSIERDGEDGEWTITFERGKLRLSANRSANWLVHALVRRKPTILLSGYTIPPL